jgi:CubicO group peptidase (beta-lactamase class C family)
VSSGLTRAWQTSTPEAQGINSTKLVKLFDRIRGLNLDSLLMVRNGYLVLEAYQYPYTADIAHHINSATKSVISALFGIAMDQGAIERIDQPMLDYFSDRTIANLDASKRAITLEHLLTMSSGLEWTNELARPRLLGELYQSKDWIQFMLDRPMNDEAGKSFAYNSGGSHLLGAIIAQATGQDLQTFAEKTLWKPLGIHSANWLLIDPQGRPFGGTGLVLTPRDMAKFGYLYLKQGQWEGEQLIPAAWVETSTRKHIAATTVSDAYGYQWWIDSRGFYMAMGYGGQLIIVSPKANMVVVFTANMPPAMTPQMMSLFSDTMLDAIESDSALPENPETVAALDAQVYDLAHPAAERVQPLPDIATNISGKVYKLEDSALGWHTLTFKFTKGASTAQSITDGISSEIGLDGLYRVSAPQNSLPTFLKGSWRGDNVFLIDIDGPGRNGVMTLSATFEGREVKLSLHNSLSDQTWSAKGTMQ